MKNPGCLVPTPNPGFRKTFTDLLFSDSLFKFALKKSVYMKTVELRHVVFMTQP